MDRMEIGSAEWEKLIHEGAGLMGLSVSPEKIDQFTTHAKELIRWTRRTNLTSITDPAEVAVKHFLDSIAPASLIPPGARLLDIGSGGGFPGIPLKILNPFLSVTLIDAVRKKVSFLNHVIMMLHLTCIEARHIRSEKIDRACRYDVIVSRALSSLEDFVVQALPLLARGGLIIALKGRATEAKTEIEQMLSGSSRILSSEVKKALCVEFQKYTLPFTQEDRTLVLINYSLS
jgi:16S rRNA (guanine527-N7)-methyltransferase